MRKDLQVTVIGLIIFVTSCLTGCGSGGGSNVQTTPTGTAFNLAELKGVYLGTATGTQYSFPNLTGSDSQGRSWSGSYTVIADGPMTFESQNVTRRRSLVTLRLAGAGSISGTSTVYFLADGTPYKSITSSGVTYAAQSTTNIPSTAKVGDFGDLGTVTGSDGTTVSGTWTLSAGANGGATLAISSVTKTGAAITATETDSFHLDASGSPTGISIDVTVTGVTVSLAGNRV